MVHFLIKNNQTQDYQPTVKNIIQMLEQNAERSPDQIAIWFVNQEVNPNNSWQVTHRQLLKLVQSAISYLHTDLGLQTGDAYSLLMANTPEILVLNLAAWASGLVVSPLSATTDSLKSKIYKINKINAKVLFAKPETFPKMKQDLQKMKKELSDTQIIELTGWKFFEKLQAYKTSKVSLEWQSFLNNDLNKTGMVLYTSGTTSLPKGVCLTPKSLLANAESIVDWLKIDEQEKFHIVLPLHHINSTVFSLATLLAGGSLILSPKYSSKRYWKIMNNFKATCSSIVPTIAHDLVSNASKAKEEQTDIANKVSPFCRRIQIGSAPVQPDVAIEFYKKFNIRLIQGYGQSETSLRSTGVPYNPDMPENEYLNLLASNSIGGELKYTQVTILRPDGTEANEGEEGEICIRGPIIMKNYYGNPETTDESFKFGWFHSGDAGYYKEVKLVEVEKGGGSKPQGLSAGKQKLKTRKLFFITGRIKELIIKGGVNISPLAVENAIMKYFIDEVDRIYSFGKQDSRYGEEVASAVIFKPHINGQAPKIIEKILKHGKNDQIPGLSSYQAPKYIYPISSDQLPMTATGKVQRVKLKNIFD